jgi:hypothetical protein
MRLHAILCAAAGAALTSSLAIGTPALATPSVPRPAPAPATATAPRPAPAQPPSPGQFAVGPNGANTSKTAGHKAAQPDDLEIFFCDPIDYGTSYFEPNFNSNNQIVSYGVDYGISEECPIPNMFMSAGVEMTDTTTGAKIDSSSIAEDFTVAIDGDSSTNLPLNNEFESTYLLYMDVVEGFLWIEAPPECVGIGSPDLVCTFTQALSTYVSNSSKQSVAGPQHVPGPTLPGSTGRKPSSAPLGHLRPAV